MYGDITFEDAAQVKKFQKKCVQDFNETAPEIFNDLLNDEDFNLKNDSASAMIRDKGNEFYQKKQFKVCKYAIWA